MSTEESLGKSENPKLKRLLCCPKTLILVFTPILSSFVFIINDLANEPGSDKRELYGFISGWVFIFLVVGIFWMTNVLTISLPGFIPLVGLPLLGVVKAGTLSESFMSNSNVAVFGNIALMIALDSGGLRKRMTLKILANTSGSLSWMYIYIFLTTIWIAMWISSAAATYLMMKIIDDILENLKAEVSKGALGMERVVILETILHKYDEEQVPEEPLLRTQTDIQPEGEQESFPDPEWDDKVKVLQDKKEQEMKLFEKENEQLLRDLGGELLYAVAVAANIGGTLWPFGSTIGNEMMKLKFSLFKNEVRWSEASWMVYSMPLLIINAFIALYILHWFTFSGSPIAKSIAGLKENRLCNYTQSESNTVQMRQIFITKHEHVGPWTFQEKALLTLVILFVCASLTRLPLFSTGWSELLPYSVKKDNILMNQVIQGRTNAGTSVICIAVLFLLFLIPKAGLRFCKGPKKTADKPKREGLLGWKTLQNKYPWALIVLIGSSRCMGRFAEQTVCKPAAERIAKALTFSTKDEFLPQTLLKLIIMGVILLCNNFISNTGAALVALQVWEKLLKSSNPTITVFPAFSAASLCFMVPASSVPTMMVYKYKERKTLSAWYFLRLGTPLFLCTLISTVIYVILWTRSGFLQF